MLNRKIQVEEHKRSAEGQLAARLELLKSRGMDERRIEKDSGIKQIKAKIGKARHQMARIAAMETLVVAKAESKARKEAEAKTPPPKAKKSVKGSAPKKPKKESKPVVDG